MPCMGPDIYYAYDQGEKAYSEVIKLLEQKYHITDHPGPFFDKDFNKAKENLKKAIQEVMWMDACDAF